LGEGKVDRCYVGRHRSWVEVGNFSDICGC
jgi:hypothetical protein